MEVFFEWHLKNSCKKKAMKKKIFGHQGVASLKWPLLRDLGFFFNDKKINNL